MLCTGALENRNPQVVSEKICKYMLHDFNAFLMHCEVFRSFELVVLEIKRTITDGRRYDLVTIIAL